jgi:hypothetical protein
LTFEKLVIGILKGKSDHCRYLGRLFTKQALVVKFYFTLFRPVKAVEMFYQGGLARPVFSKDCNSLASENVKGDII